MTGFLGEEIGRARNTERPVTENIWVGVRLRPLSTAELQIGDIESCEVQYDGKTLLCRDTQHKQTFGGTPEPVDDSKSARAYVFDSTFAPGTSNEDVYRRAAQNMVLAACEGFNGTIFAYGQTGSGKTYTMNPLMLLSFEEVFCYINRAPEREFLLRLSATEVYNEAVHDLLSEDRHAQLKLRTTTTETVAQGMSEQWVESMEQLRSMLETIGHRREVRDTRANDRSSRGHLIVTLKMESRPSEFAAYGDAEVSTNLTVMTSVLTFVDLAGSERSRQVSLDDGSERQRMKEGSQINCSLLTLGKVIRALSRQKRQHVPFRESMLTQMLKPVLGGNTRTAIVCTISPASTELDNTRSTLQFAQDAKRVTTMPQVNKIQDAKAEIRSLQNEISVLRRQLAEQAQATPPPASPAQSTSPEKLQGTDEDAQRVFEARLLEKEELVRLTKEQRDEAERRLRGLEKLILRADPGRAMPSVRASWAPSSTLLPNQSYAPAPPPIQVVKTSVATSIRGSDTKPKQAVLKGMRSSWNPGDSMNSYSQEVSRSHAQAWPPQLRRTGDDSAPLLLNCFLSPSVLKRMKRTQGPSTRSTAEGAKATAEAEIRNLKVPSGESARAALEALQAEVRFMKQTQGSAADAIKILQDELLRIEEEQVIDEFLDAAKEETISALRTEIERLKSQREAEAEADQALASLKEKLNFIAASQEPQSAATGAPPALRVLSPVGEPEQGHQELPEPSPAGPTPGLSPEQDIRFQALVRSPSASPLLESPRASIFGPFPKQPEGVPGASQLSPLQPSRRGNSGKENRSTRNISASVATGFFQLKKPREPADEDGYESPSINLYREELKKVKAFKAAAEKDLVRLQGCLDDYKEQAERLDCQKKLLLNQVLRLEFKLEEANEAQAYMSQQIAAAETRAEAAKDDLGSVQAELEEARATIAQLEGSQALQQHRGSSSMPVSLPLDVKMSMVDRDNTGNWAAPPTVDSLLPRIVMLWEELSVPLLHRSRFFQAFRGRELFYYEAEQRRLEHSALRVRVAEDSSPERRKASSAWHQKAALKLQWERNWLASQLKWEFPEADRLEVFDEWGVPRDIKRRKHELLGKVWSNEVTKDGHDKRGMERSAQLVLRLHGQDATDGMWDLVFGREATPDHRSGSGFSAAAVANSLKAIYKKPLHAINMMRSPGNWKTPRRRTFSTGFSSVPGTPHSQAALPT